MKSKKQIKEWLLKNAYDEKTNTIDLSELEFWDKDVDISRLGAKNINNKAQSALGKIFNTIQKAQEISNVAQEAENHLSNFAQECWEGKIDNTFQSAKKGILNDKQKPYTKYGNLEGEKNE